MGLVFGRTSAKAPLAIVTGADHPTGLGAARAVYKVGARVWGLADRPQSPACRSRVWEELHTRVGAPNWVETLGALSSDLQEPAFLLPTDDRHVNEISERRSELHRAYRFRLPAHDVVRLFMEKTRFYSWAKDRGLPLPETHIARSQSELTAILRHIRYPVIVKPLYRTIDWDRLSPVDKVLRLEKAGDLQRTSFDLFAAASAYVVSEWISGPDHQVHYCLAYCGRPGEITASYSGKKLLQYPRRTGSTAVCVGMGPGQVRELAEEIFAAVEFEGLGSLEVKYDPDGRPFITEPTVGRPNLQSYSAVVGGCNLQAIAMADALGLDGGSLLAKPKKSWWIQEGAVREIILSSGGAAPVPWSLLFREILTARAFGGAYGTWWDPGPLFALLMETVRRAVQFLRRRVGQETLPPSRG